MKLDRLTLLNFQRIADLDLDLSKAKVHLFAGRNEAGKSTIKDAIRFAICGDSPRVELKKDYRRLVRRSGKKGSVTLQYDGEGLISRDVATGKTDADLSLPEEALTAASLAFGSQTFVDLKLEERLIFLFQLTQVRTDPDEIIARLRKREVAEPLVERLRGFFKHSLGASHTQCVEELKRLRAKWSQVAGENYGSKKAEDWTPTPQEKLADEDFDVESLGAQIDLLRATVADFNQQLGTKQSEVEQRAKLLASQQRLESYVHNLPTLQRDLDGLKRELEGGTVTGDDGQPKTIAGLKDEVTTWEELIELGEKARAILTCPSCGHALKMGPEDLEFVDSGEVNYTKSDEELQELRGKVVAGRARMKQLAAQIEEVTRKVGAAQNSSNLNQDIASRLQKLAKPEEIDLVRTNLTEAENELRNLESQLTRAREYETKLQRAEQDRATAAALHKQIKEWTVAEEALAPTGIQQELLTEALKSINDRMLASARAVGWPAPSITADMEIMREGGDTYGLLSESAQWRVSVIVADAIASLSGINLLILDRMDVLDPPSRVPFMEWITKIAAGYDTIFVMGTMKERPPSIPGVEVHWLEDGEVK